MRNVRVLARGAIRAMELDDNVPPDVGEALGELAAAVRALADALEGGRRLRGTSASTRARGRGIATAVLRGHDEPVRERHRRPDPLHRHRPAGGAGMSYEEATAAVRDAVREGS